MKLKVTVRQNISQLFDDLDNGNADLLAAGLVYDSARVKNYQPGPMYYSVSQQLVYRVGQYRPRSLATVNENQLTIAPGHVVVNDLQRLKETKFPDLSWKVDDKKGSTTLLEEVISGKLDYTIADSVAISLFQRVHPELAVALDVTDEQPVTWFSRLDDDNTLSAALLDFSIRSMKTVLWRGSKRNIWDMAMISTTLIPALSCERWITSCRSWNRYLKNMPKR